MSVDTREAEAEVIDIQIVTSFLFILTLIVSIFLNINERNKILYNEPFLTDEQADAILKTNRIVILGLFFVFLSLAFRNKEIDQIKNEDLTADNLEIIVSILAIIGGLIVLYSVYNYSEDTPSIYGNPAV